MQNTALGTSGSQSKVGKGGFQLEPTSHGFFSLQTHVFLHAQLPVGPGKHLTPTRPCESELHCCSAVCNKPPDSHHAPNTDSTRNCLLLVGHDFAALSHNAPDCLSQRKSPVALVIPHTETTSPAGSPPSMGSEYCRVWLSQDFLFLPAPAGPPHHPQLIAASPTPPGLDAQLPQTGSEESPALCPLFWGCSSPKG